MLAGAACDFKRIAFGWRNSTHHLHDRRRISRRGRGVEAAALQVGDAGGGGQINPRAHLQNLSGDSALTVSGGNSGGRPVIRSVVSWLAATQV